MSLISEYEKTNFRVHNIGRKLDLDPLELQWKPVMTYISLPGKQLLKWPVATHLPTKE